MTEAVEDERGPTPLEQAGGVPGLIYAGLPSVAFALGNSAFGLSGAIWIAVATGAAIAAWRWLRNQPLQPAISGLFGVAISAFVAYQIGSAKGFFLTGIWMNLVAALLFTASVLAGWPLAGVIWHGLTGAGRGWHEDPPSRFAFTLATLAMASVFGSRFAVQEWLYTQDSVGWLAVARIAMGYPLFGAALLVVIWAVRRSKRRASHSGSASAVADHVR
ncbi:DUF3159 domain-containing protein [Mycobacterium sp. CBMA271]|uniref:DUF3159 domain-containing protein n=1 Tax=unclassified Mycobacteroides TaxID=2618759 RepID=UPI00132129ED|nr:MULTISPECIES: DUF3159 domain-containing protein [unclassified Mycobacteroides]MUM19315.1 hypothetical protein [Mycobacteroides sp. CBMA 326]MUM21727.1 DUF3159 domain-containing protein [Mycobacteroides sp. CBMA 271]